MPKEKPMKLEILHIADCPGVVLLEQRIAEAIAGVRAEVVIARRVFDSDSAATDVGMTGSPTLLIDGHDPFAEPGLRASLSCRLYRADGGEVDRAPSVTALRAALDQRCADRTSRS
jgi:hypothetical protein